ncbi:MAG TPA: 6-phosphogluconolactonase [Candidatus Nanopelagicales bacterium]
MRHALQVLPDAEAVARAAALHLAERARAAVAHHGRCAIAVSGGRTPWRMLEALVALPAGQVPWPDLVVHQVDERVAPAGDPDRNSGRLLEVLRATPARVLPMPVEAPDLDAAAAAYAAALPERFDLVHLGLGADGHTASLVPGDGVLDVTDRLVALTAEPYQGRRRMTLTYPALARADQLLWLVTGSAKAAALRGLLAGATDIPAGRVSAADSLVMADAEAAAQQSEG